MLLTNLLVGLGTLVGVVALIRKRSIYALPLAAFPLIYPLIYYATHPSLRYRHPIDPMLMILVAIGLAGIFSSPSAPDEVLATR